MDVEADDGGVVKDNDEQVERATERWSRVRRDALDRTLPEQGSFSEGPRFPRQLTLVNTDYPRSVHPTPIPRARCGRHMSLEPTGIVYAECVSDRYFSVQQSPTRHGVQHRNSRL